MRLILKGVIFVFLALLAVFVGIMMWSSAPINIDVNKADPAVVLANELTASEPDYRSTHVGERGSRIHYVQAGNSENEPIIFLHGFPSYWFSMFRLMDELKSDYHVIAIDGLGVGHSDAPKDLEAYRLEALAGHLDSVIDDLGYASVHLVGHDWGAGVATAYAKAYPHKVRTLTNMSGPPHDVLLNRLDSDASHRKTFSYVNDFKRASPMAIKALGIKDQLWESVFARYPREGLMTQAEADRFYADVGNPRRLNRLIHWYRANIPDFDTITDEDFWPSRNARLTVPALFIYSDDDPVITEGVIADVENMSASLKTLEFSSVGHRPHFVEREAVASAIRDLIEGG